jgi:ketopantoate reductase
VTDDWKKAHAQACEPAIRHELVEIVIAELLDNLGLKGQALPEYGIRKVATYAAQVARAQALSFDPDLLRLSDEEADAAILAVARQAVAAGKPTWAIRGDDAQRLD